MHSEITKAKSILKKSAYTCVLLNGQETISSSLRGVNPLLDLIDSGKDLKGFIAADKIVGKAAAFLYVILGIKYVYAEVISKTAIRVFTTYGIDYSYDLSVDSIVNRSGSGLCPMEDAVSDINEPETALVAIKKRLAELQSNK